LEKGKEKEGKERKGKQRSSKEELDQAATMGLLAGIELHV
jgi:hypothetical protein